MQRRAVWVWGLLVLIGVSNGILRQKTYGKALSELRAHQVSTGACVLGVLAGVYLTMRRAVQSASAGTLLLIGAAWALATVAFEFMFGRCVARESWTSLLQNYNVAAGRVWSAVPLTLLLAPLLVKRVVDSGQSRGRSKTSGGPG